MQMSQTIGELAASLAKAQGAMRAAAKDRENPYFKSSYATLASVIDAIRVPFSENGLAFVQPTRVDDHGNVYVTTAILHSSGQWISGEASAKPVKSDPQGVGSLISYLKRYGLQAMVGVASADEDDDGNAASSPRQTQQAAPRPRGGPAKTADDGQDRGSPFAPTNEQHKAWLWTEMKKRNIAKADAMAIIEKMRGRFEDELSKVVADWLAEASRM